MIHEDFWSPIDLLIFSVLWCSNFCFYPDSVSSFVLSRYGGFFVTEHEANELLDKQDDCQPRMHEL